MIMNNEDNELVEVVVPDLLLLLWKRNNSDKIKISIYHLFHETWVVSKDYHSNIAPFNYATALTWQYQHQYHYY